MIKTIFRSLLKFNRQVDHLLLSLCIICSAISIVLIYGIYSAGFVKLRVLEVQIVATTIGIIGAMIISIVDYHFIVKFWRLYYPASVGLVLLTYIFGVQRYSHIDDKAWLPMPFINGLTFQPSEILKLAFILTLAYHLEKARETINDPRAVLGIVIHAGFTTALILGQGDHGTALVFVAISACMVFAAGIAYRYICGFLVAAVAASPLVWFFILDDDKRARILSVYSPEFVDTMDKGYQQSLGITSIGAGQVWGKGLFREDVQYIPEMHNDFIFSYIGETFGFVGTLAILILIGALCIMILINAKKAEDLVGRYICIGVFAIIIFQSFWCIGMSLELIPVIGLTLPFFSAGGTSVVMTYASIGLVLNVHRHSRTNIFAAN